jgi:hypothetical protein
MALGSVSTTVPTTSIASSLGIAFIRPAFHGSDNGVKNLIDRPVSVYFDIDAVLLKVSNQRLGRRMIDMQPFRNNFRSVILPLNQPGSAGIAPAADLGRIQARVKDCAALQAHPSRRKPLDQYRVYDIDAHSQNAGIILFEQRSDEFRLKDRSRISVQDKSLPAVFASQPLGDEGIHNTIRDQRTGFHEHLCLFPQLRFVPESLAEYIARRDMGKL